MNKVPTAKPSKELLQQRANDLLAPGSLCGIALGSILSPKDEDIAAHIMAALDRRVAEVEAGDTKSLEGMLTAQAHLLNGLFVTSLQSAQVNQRDYPAAHERYMRLAFKAQAQCRATVETIAAVKNPPVFATNANLVRGHQQVNIGAPHEAERALFVDQPHAAIPACLGPPLSGEDTLGQPLPVTGDAERAVPDARRPVARRAKGKSERLEARSKVKGGDRA